MPTAFSSLGSGESQPLSVVPGNLNSADACIAPDVSATVLPLEETQADSRHGESDRAPQRIVGFAQHDTTPRSMQRIADVRKQQGLSLRTISRRTGIDVKELRRHEDPAQDLLLSDLRKWQQALEVPLADLVEDDQTLSRPVMERAKLVRIMKTAVSLRDAVNGNVRLERLTGMLCDQLLDLMPELKEVGSWPQTGARRGADVMGRIFHEPIAVESPDSE